MHLAGARRGDRVDRLHRFDDQQRLALGDRVADLDEGRRAGLGREIGGADHRRGHGAGMRRRASAARLARQAQLRTRVRRSATGAGAATWCTTARGGHRARYAQAQLAVLDLDFASGRFRCRIAASSRTKVGVDRLSGLLFAHGVPVSCSRVLPSVARAAAASTASR